MALLKSIEACGTIPSHEYGGCERLQTHFYTVTGTVTKVVEHPEGHEISGAIDGQSCQFAALVKNAEAASVKVGARFKFESGILTIF